MRSKWYISTFIIILSVLGAVFQQGVTLPNQEIVLQFANSEVTLEEAQSTISTVKQQLEIIGVDEIQVQEQGDGRLKITYYSDSDVASIKKILSDNQAIELDLAAQSNQDTPVQSPTDQNPNSYNLDVYEIQDGGDTLDLGGKFALELKSDTDRLFNTNVYVHLLDSNDDDLNKKVRTALKLNRTIALAIEDIEYKIPEVRAGPSSNGIQNLNILVVFKITYSV